jgi:hypothetical protein
LVLDSKFASSKPAEDDGFLSAIKNRSKTAFGEEINSSTRAARFYGMLKIPAEYEIDISSAKFTDISRQVSLDSLVVVSAGTCQRSLLDESGMIITQIGTNNRLKWSRCMGHYV